MYNYLGIYILLKYLMIGLVKSYLVCGLLALNTKVIDGPKN